jgi:hypothetical protein
VARGSGRAGISSGTVNGAIKRVEALVRRIEGGAGVINR